MKQIRALVLCENTVFGQGALAEHGWAVWLETLSGNFLFDTGQGKSLLHNAFHFGVDFTSLRAILLSHHHYDHTGGLLDALRALSTRSARAGVPVFGHLDLFKDSYSMPTGKRTRHIGMPFTRAALEGAGANFNLDIAWTTVKDGIHLTGEVPRLTDFELGDLDLKHFVEPGGLVSDPIVDDQSLVVETSRGLFVVLGCSHAGVINTLNYIVEKTGRSYFQTVMVACIYATPPERRSQTPLQRCSNLRSSVSAWVIAPAKGLRGKSRRHLATVSSSAMWALR